jgi:hypothetical protein
VVDAEALGDDARELVGVRTPRSTSTSPVRRPLVRDSAIASSTDSGLA